MACGQGSDVTGGGKKGNNGETYEAGEKKKSAIIW